MDTTNLWEKLTPLSETLETLKEDYKRGVTPELPYFMVSQEQVKSKLEDKISKIDSCRFDSSFVIGDYGSGKTNLLKYLELYCKEFGNGKLIPSYKRADVDKPDIFLTLLSHIEFKHIELLLQEIIKLNEQENAFDTYKTLVRDFNNFEEIKEYVEAIAKEKDKDNLLDLIYLGTGRLYTKAAWSKFNLRQLNDFNRREIFIFFMNIFSHAGKYLIFEIDELEKIREKSKARFRNFLTSFRELIDLSSYIEGHMVIVAMTTAIDSLQENQAFFRRIQSDILDLQYINKNEFNNLYSLIQELFKTNHSDVNTRINKIERNLKKSGLFTNGNLVASMALDVVNTPASVTQKINLEASLTEHSLHDLFNETFQDAEYIHGFKDIHNSFFDPLNYYLEEEGYNNFDLRRKERILDVKELNKYIVWNFSEATLSKDLQKIKTLENKNSKVQIVMPLSYHIPHNDCSDKFEIISVNPKDIFTLLEMYQLYPDYSKELGEMIRGTIKL